MRKSIWISMVGVSLLTGGAALPADTLLLGGNGSGAQGPGAQEWSRWQGRLSFGTAPTTWRPFASSYDRPAVKLGRLSLMGDYYLSPSTAGAARIGGLRATGGMILGPSGRPWLGQPAYGGDGFTVANRVFGDPLLPTRSETGSDTAAMPYLGLGYTGLSTNRGWSLNADFGIVAQGAGSSRLGRALGGGQNLDDAVRDLRLAPLLQVGVSYAF